MVVVVTGTVMLTLEPLDSVTMTLEVVMVLVTDSVWEADDSVCEPVMEPLLVVARQLEVAWSTRVRRDSTWLKFSWPEQEETRDWMDSLSDEYQPTRAVS